MGDMPPIIYKGAWMSLEPGNDYFLDLYLEDENFSSIDFG